MLNAMLLLNAMATIIAVPCILCNWNKVGRLSIVGFGKLKY